MIARGGNGKYSEVPWVAGSAPLDGSPIVIGAIQGVNNASGHFGSIPERRDRVVRVRRRSPRSACETRPVLSQGGSPDSLPSMDHDQSALRARYLKLVKDTLLFSLWPEPATPLTRLNEIKTPARRMALSAVSKALDSRGLEISKRRAISEFEREEGRVWPRYADSMIGRKRMDNLQSCVETVLNERIPGDLIETGVWRGGSCIFMRAILAAYGSTDRRIFVADSFEGLPPPNVGEDAGDRHHTFSSCLGVSREQVEENFRRYDLLDEQVVFLQGWFKDTLPAAPIDHLAVLRLDGDMYGSTMDGLALYDKLASGGFLIIDDYGLPGCKQAIDDFRRDRGVDEELIAIDWTGAYWRKS